MSVSIDAPDTYGAVDESGLLDVALATADQWAAALAAARATNELPTGTGITSVVYCGMGGSGIAGDLLAVVMAERGSVPVTVVKGYDLPAFVGPDTLVIAASYSGNTEETLSCARGAFERGARVVSITTGGALAALAADNGAPVLSAPAGFQPRAALASLAAPTLVLVDRLGLADGLTASLDATEPVLRDLAARIGPAVGESENDAKSLARALIDKTPLVWGQDGALGAAAVRWRCQLNENAKVPAFSSIVPELDHNEIVGYDPGVDGLRDLAIIVLRGEGEHDRVAARIGYTLDEMRDRVASVHEVHVPGGDVCARFMAASLFADVTSIYLALLRGVDPTPVDVIGRLKARLGS